MEVGRGRGWAWVSRPQGKAVFELQAVRQVVRSVGQWAKGIDNALPSLKLWYHFNAASRGSAARAGACGYGLRCTAARTGPRELQRTGCKREREAELLGGVALGRPARLEHSGRGQEQGLVCWGSPTNYGRILTARWDGT